MPKTPYEQPAARLLRLRQQVADLEYLVQKTTNPAEAARLRIKLRDQRAGLRLLTQ